MVGVWSLIQNSSLTIRSSLSLSQVAVSEGKEFYDGDPNCLKTMNKGRHVEICRQETPSLKENLNNLDQQSGTILCVDVPRRNAMRPLGHQGARCQEHLSVDCAQHYSNLVICLKNVLIVQLVGHFLSMCFPYQVFLVMLSLVTLSNFWRNV